MQLISFKRDSITFASGEFRANIYIIDNFELTLALLMWTYYEYINIFFIFYVLDLSLYYSLQYYESFVLNLIKKIAIDITHLPTPRTQLGLLGPKTLMRVSSIGY